MIETCTEVASPNRRRFSRTVRCSEFRDSRMRADGRCSPLAALSRALLGKTQERYDFSSSRCRKNPLILLCVYCLRFLMKYQNFQVELVDGSSYLAQPLPFSISTLIRIKVLVTGYIEFQHNAELYSEAFVPINVV